MTSQESEALCIFAEQTGSQVTVADTYLTVVSYRTCDTECLQTDTDCLSSVSSICATLLDSDGSTYYVCPASVFETDRLSFLTHCIRIDTLGVADSLCVFDTVDTIFT